MVAGGPPRLGTGLQSDSDTWSKLRAVAVLAPGTRLCWLGDTRAKMTLWCRYSAVRDDHWRHLAHWVLPASIRLGRLAVRRSAFAPANVADLLAAVGEGGPVWPWSVPSRESSRAELAGHKKVEGRPKAALNE